MRRGAGTVLGATGAISVVTAVNRLDLLPLQLVASSPQSFADGRFYLVSEVALPRSVPAVELARIPPGYDGKAYFLYEVAPGLPEERRQLPRCVPGMRPFPPKA